MVKLPLPARALDEDSNCVICLNCIDEDDAGVLPCNHNFCFSCIERWSQTENTCPLCKVKFDNVERTRNTMIGVGTRSGRNRSSSISQENVAITERSQAEANRENGLQSILPIMFASMDTVNFLMEIQVVSSNENTDTSNTNANNGTTTNNNTNDQNDNPRNNITFAFGNGGQMRSNNNRNRTNNTSQAPPSHIIPLLMMLGGLPPPLAMLASISESNPQSNNTTNMSRRSRFDSLIRSVSSNTSRSRSSSSSGSSNISNNGPPPTTTTTYNNNNNNNSSNNVELSQMSNPTRIDNRNNSESTNSATSSSITSNSINSSQIKGSNTTTSNKRKRAKVETSDNPVDGISRVSSRRKKRSSKAE